MNTRKKISRKSLAVDTGTHQQIKKLAHNLGISLPKCLKVLVDEKLHRDKIARKKMANEFEELDIQAALNQINRLLQKIEKRENPRDTIVAFFRMQEREILNPMKLSQEKTAATLEELLNAINKLQ